MPPRYSTSDPRIIQLPGGRKEDYVVTGMGRLGMGSKPLVHRGSFADSIRRTAASTDLTAPDIRNPLLNQINFFLPQNVKVLNQWCRYYAMFNEIVGNCIDAHGEYPISTTHLEGIDDPAILKKYEYMENELDTFNFELSGSREYELIGEFFPMAHWNTELNMWDELTILNPDFVVVNEAYLAYKNKLQIELEPDEDLKRIIFSSDPRDIELRQNIDPKIIAAVEMGENIRLDEFCTAQIARKNSPYDPRGKSIILRALKTLMYDDRLIELQYAVADGLITPKTIWKLGDPQNGYMPSDEDLDDFRNLLKAGAHDPLHAIVTHYGLNVEYIGAAGKIHPITPEREANMQRILIALYTNKAVMMGEGPGFSAGPQVAFQYLQGRYMSKRQKLQRYFKEKIYIPFAIANGFWKKQKDGTKELILPDRVYDQKLDLVEDAGRRQFLSQMRDRMQVSFETLAEVFDIDAEQEVKRLEKERGTPVDPVMIEKYKNDARADLSKETGKEAPAPSSQKTPGFDNAPSEMKIKEPTNVKPPSTPGVKTSERQAGYFKRGRKW